MREHGQRMPVARHYGCAYPFNKSPVEVPYMWVIKEVDRVVPVYKSITECREIDRKCYESRSGCNSSKSVHFVHPGIISKKGFESQ